MKATYSLDGYISILGDPAEEATAPHLGTFDADGGTWETELDAILLQHGYTLAGPWVTEDNPQDPFYGGSTAPVAEVPDDQQPAGPVGVARVELNYRHVFTGGDDVTHPEHHWSVFDPSRVVEDDCEPNGRGYRRLDEGADLIASEDPREWARLADAALGPAWRRVTPWVEGLGDTMTTVVVAVP